MFKRIKSGLDILANSAIVIVAILLLWTLLKPDAGADDGVDALEDVAMSASLLTKRVGTGDRILLEFADFQCSYCAEYALEDLPRLKRELVDAGRLSYAYLHFPLKGIHPEAAMAGVAAECAGQQEKFWEMHDRLFANQGRLSNKEFASQARAIGLDSAQFGECMQSEEAAAAVETDFKQGLALGVRATPTFFIGTIGVDGMVELSSRIRGQVALEGIEAALARDEGGLASWWSWLR